MFHRKQLYDSRVSCHAGEGGEEVKNVNTCLAESEVLSLAGEGSEEELTVVVLGATAKAEERVWRDTVRSHPLSHVT